MSETPHKHPLGLAGGLTRAFIDSALTPLERDMDVLEIPRRGAGRLATERNELRSGRGSRIGCGVGVARLVLVSS